MYILNILSVMKKIEAKNLKKIIFGNYKRLPIIDYLTSK